VKKLLLFLLLLAFDVDGQNAQHVLDSLGSKLVNAPADTSRVLLLNEIARLNHGKDYDKVEKLAGEMLLLSEQLKYTRGLALANNLLGSSNYFRGNYVAAIHYYTLAYRLFEKTADKRGVSRVLNNLGNIYNNRGDYSKALDSYLEGLRMATLANDQVVTSACLINIGNVYTYQGDISHKKESYRKALGYFDKALVVFEKSGDKNGMASCQNNIGSVYQELGKLTDSSVFYLRALDYYTKSLDASRVIGNKTNVSTTYNNIANLYVLTSEFELSRQYMDKAIVLAAEMKDKSRLALYSKDMGELYFAQKNFNAAIEAFETSMRMARELKSLSQVNFALQGLAKSWAMAGDHKKAYAYQSMFKQVSDSIYSEETTRKTTQSEMNSEFEKKQYEQQLVQTEKDILQAQELKQQKFFRNSFIAGFGLMVLLAFFIYRSYADKQKANIAITKQKEIIEEKNRDITDSIHYAKRIQGALLASDHLLKKNLPEYFILYKPKDIVSGDFYWAYAHQSSGQFLLCTADCTGHGVPGAFMSLLNVSFLNDAVVEKRISAPHLVLDHVREQIISALNPEGAQAEGRDGMDAILCAFDLKNMKLDFACANNSLWIVRHENNIASLVSFNADKMPVGLQSQSNVPFTLQSTALRKGDVVYSFTDGYADQFGGPKGKKFKYRQLEELLLSISSLPMQEQRKVLEERFDLWKGTLEQVDDVLVIGVSV